MGGVPTSKAREPRAWLVAAAALAAVRLFHLGGPIDDPHSWRQCDTAYYSLHMARHGIDLLHPQVCWLGGRGTLALEFPLPEAASALLQRAFGIGPLWDRVVSLGFFVMATAYFHALARRVLAARAASLATLAYLALPLGIFFSRAAVVDFAAVAFAHAFLHHGLSALAPGRSRPLALAAVFGALAALIKAPVLAPVAIALLWVAFRSGRGAWLRAALPLSIASLVFALWRVHVERMNAGAPDWSFIPGYHKLVGRWGWYFGDTAGRLDLGAWAQLLERVLHEVTTWPGALLAVLGAWSWRGAAPPGPASARGLAAAWAAGVTLSLVVFWPLNLLHDYYQIPLLAPAALAIGAGGERLFSRRALGAAAFGFFLLWCVVASHAIGYFRRDEFLIAAGKEAAAIVPAEDLVIAAFPGSRYADPRLLFRADRRGWSLGVSELTPELVRRLKQEGARWVIVAADRSELRGTSLPESLRVAERAIAAGNRNAAPGRLEVYSLDRFR